MNFLSYLFASLAAIVAGMFNAWPVWTLITFPTLLFIGLSPVVANVTNTIALCPGFLGGPWPDQRLEEPEKTLWLAVPAALLGGLTGDSCCCTPAKSFSQSGAIPDPAGCRLLASRTRCGLAYQPPSKGSRKYIRKPGSSCPSFWRHLRWLLWCRAEYHHAGNIGLMLNDNLTRLNALKQSIGFLPTWPPQSSSCSRVK